MAGPWAAGEGVANLTTAPCSEQLALMRTFSMPCNLPEAEGSSMCVESQVPGGGNVVPGVGIVPEAWRLINPHISLMAGGGSGT